MAFQYVRADQGSEYTDDVIITNTHKAGIGTTAPTAKTEIDGGAAVAGVGNVSTNGVSITATFSNSTDYNNLQVGTLITANNETMCIISKNGSNLVTINRPPSIVVNGVGTVSSTWSTVTFSSSTDYNNVLAGTDIYVHGGKRTIQSKNGSNQVTTTISPTNGVGTISSSGTTVTFSSVTDYDNVLIGTQVTANSQMRTIVSKNGSNQVTVDSAPSPAWSNNSFSYINDVWSNNAFTYVNPWANQSFFYRNPLLKLSENSTNRVMVRADGAFAGDIIATGPWFDVRAYGATPLQIRGSAWWNDGHIDASANRITVSGIFDGRFEDAQVGDSLWILNGTNYGRYTITNKDSVSYNWVEVADFLYDQINVTWHVTEGVADCTQAFLDAIAAAAAGVGGMQSNPGVVYVPRGEYRITSKLTIPIGVSLVGAGRAGTFIIADFAEKTGTGTFTNGNASVTNITGPLSQYDYVKVATDDFTALARVESINGSNATLHVGYYGSSGTGLSYKTVTPVIENTTNNASIREITIDSAQMKEHVGINLFHSSYNTLHNITISHMYVGIFVTNSYTDGRHVIVHECRTGIQFGNPGYDPNSGAGWPDWSTCNYFYGGGSGECSEYGVRFVQAWGNFIYSMDIGYNVGPDMVAGVSLENHIGGDVVGNNTLIGCFSEHNDPCIVKIASPGNNIIGCNLNSGLMGVFYTGTGSKDDMHVSGAFTGTTPTRYRVEIDGTGTPDTFRWYDKTGPITKFAEGSGNTIVTAPGHGLAPGSYTITIFGTTNYNGQHTANYMSNDAFTIDTAWSADDGKGYWKTTSPVASGVQITGGDQSLNNGVTVKFGSTTGHTTADSWFFAGRTIYDLSGNTEGTMLSGNYEATPTGVSRDMRLLSSKLGVGTASPDGEMHIKGNLSVPLPSLASCDVGVSHTKITCNNHGLAAGDGVKLPSGWSGEFEIFTVASVQDANTFFVDDPASWSFTNQQGYCDPALLKIDNGDGVNKITVDKSGNINIENPDNSREIFFSDNGQIRSCDDNHRIIFDRSNNILELREYGSIHLSEADGTVNMAVRSSGDSGGVGIGTTSPANKLSVAGNASIGSDYAETAAPANGMIVEGAVGIGTTSPSKKLHLRGEMLIDDDNPAHPGWQSGSVVTLSLGDTYSFLKNTNGYPGIGSFLLSSNNPLRIETTSTAGYNNISIIPGADGSGGVGIGTTSPQGILEVNPPQPGSAGVGKDIILTAQQGKTNNNGGNVKINGGAKDGTGSDGNVLLATDLGAVGIGPTSPGSKLQVWGNAAIGYEASQAGPANGLAVWGSVGIGEANPASKLEVSDNGSNPVLTITNKSDTAHNPSIAFRLGATPSTKFTLGVDDTDGDKLKIGTTSVDTNTRVTIDSTGSVGIGNTAPASKLEISDSDTTASRAGLKVSQTGAISGTGYGVYASKTGASTTNVGGYLSASGATNNYGLIVDQGSVGIGTTTPASTVKLDVYGNINVASSYGYRVNSTQVVGARKAAVSPVSIVTTQTAGATYTNNERTMLNNLKADVTSLKNSLNDLIAKLSSTSGHGLLT